MEPSEAETGATAGRPGVGGAPQPAAEEASCGVDGGADLHGDDIDGFYSSSADEFDLEFEFAALPPPSAAGDADDIFDAGRIRAAYYYPVFARPHPDDVQDQHRGTSGSQQPDAAPAASTSPDASEGAPEGGDYCVWVPKKPSASSAAAAEVPDTAWKSRSAGAAEASRRWRLRDIMQAPGRSHSDGTHKFAFLAPAPHHHAERAPPHAAAGTGKPPASGSKTKSAEPSGRRPGEHRHKKGSTELDIVTAHRLFYAKNGAQGSGGGQHHRQSYLPYRTDLVGHFSSGGSGGPHTRFLPF